MRDLHPQLLRRVAADLRDRARVGRALEAVQGKTGRIEPADAEALLRRLDEEDALDVLKAAFARSRRSAR